MSDSEVISPIDPAIRHPKGAMARQRLLQVALELFGAQGFQATTTRQIAETAEQTLPAIRYYFGNKEGLYMACAQSIVASYRDTMGATGSQALRALQAGGDKACLKTALHALLTALVHLLVGNEDARRWSAFITRETQNPGAAHELLYEQIWAPGVLVVARLLAAIQGRPEIATSDRLQAVLLISAITAFQSTSGITHRLVGWSHVGPGERDQVAATVRQLVERAVE